MKTNQIFMNNRGNETYSSSSNQAAQNPSKPGKLKFGQNISSTIRNHKKIPTCSSWETSKLNDAGFWSNYPNFIQKNIKKSKVKRNAKNVKNVKNGCWWQHQKLWN